MALEHSSTRLHARKDNRHARSWPALDGLRGTAILAVLLCHYASLLPRESLLTKLLADGWAGVDLFFVLSGFLITGVLLEAKGSPHYFRNFYARRALRIFPLYFGVLLVVLCVLLLIRFNIRAAQALSEESHKDVRLLWNYQPWLWTYTMNFKLAFEKGSSNVLDCIAPLWSLSIEEQFYLLWPLAVFRFPRRTLIVLCVAIFVAALMLRILLTYRGVDHLAIYTLTPTRADALAAGACLALILRPHAVTRRARRALTAAGIVAAFFILVGLNGFDPGRHPFQRDLLYSTLAIFFAALIFWSIDPQSLRGIPARFYNARFLRRIGLYSYGMYIFHMPILYITKAFAVRYNWYDANIAWWSAGIALAATNLLLTMTIAAASFHLFERKFLQAKRFFVRSRTDRGVISSTA